MHSSQNGNAALNIGADLGAGLKSDMREVSEAALSRAIKTALRLFQSLRCPYMMIGALALSLWGRPRGTLDLDFMVQIEATGFSHLLQQAKRYGLTVDRAFRRVNPMLRRSQIQLRSGALRFDLLRPRDRHDQEAFKRRQRRGFLGHRLWVPAAEDLLLQKLKTGRPRDFEDAASIVTRQHLHLDKRYLRRWARQLGVTEELQYLIRHFA